MPAKSFIRFCDTLDEAASSCESDVDIVAASIPAIIRPATRAAITPCVDIRLDIWIMIVSDADEPSR